MATVAVPPRPTTWDCVTLEDVAWGTYCALRDAEANDHVRMTYLDGSLTLMSPALRHDIPIGLLERLIQAVTAALDVEVMDIRTTTMRQAAPPGESRGAGKEADAAFYIGESERRMRTRDELDLSVDPPPDLAVEVDNSRDSATALAIYARLGVPEVWRYRVDDRSVTIHRLDGGAYREVERSGVLPVLTPARILEALDRYAVGDLGQNAWSRWVEAWARGLAGPGGAG